MSLRDRIGSDAGGVRLEDTLKTAISHGFHYLDFNIETEPNRPDAWTDDRVRSIRDMCERNDVHLALHTASSVNIAEYAMFVGDAVDQYLRIYIELSKRLGCD
ncbi:MAG: sugar phosphate isomerase/epimerase, partial [Dehalococcoidia bacterium]|nr:sugar phosphate isomerase/epimerase [Dehalococcoidia bacterium]